MANFYDSVIDEVARCLVGKPLDVRPDDYPTVGYDKAEVAGYLYETIEQPNMAGNLVCTAFEIWAADNYIDLDVGDPSIMEAAEAATGFVSAWEDVFSADAPIKELFVEITMGQQC